MMTEINQQRQSMVECDSNGIIPGIYKVYACRSVCVCVWLLLTADKWLEVWLDICALLRDVQVTGQLVRKLLTRLDDRALETQGRF